MSFTNEPQVKTYQGKEVVCSAFCCTDWRNKSVTNLPGIDLNAKPAPLPAIRKDVEEKWTIVVCRKERLALKRRRQMMENP